MLRPTSLVHTTFSVVSYLLNNIFAFKGWTGFGQTVDTDVSVEAVEANILGLEDNLEDNELLLGSEDYHVNSYVRSPLETLQVLQSKL